MAGQGGYEDSVSRPLIHAVKDNLARVRERIEAAASRAGCSAEEITLVAVSKGVDLGRIRAALEAGVQHLGESRVQEAWSKWPDVPSGVVFHLVGHLQTNKVKRAVEMFDLIQSVDGRRLAREVARRAQQRGKVQRVLLQVNTAGEESKYGVAPEELPALVEEIASLEGIAVEGLMTIGPLAPEAEVRRAFRRLARLYRDLEAQQIRNVSMRYLSMGMSSDFEVAIEEGANMVRIGTAIFGPRY